MSHVSCIRVMSLLCESCLLCKSHVSYMCTCENSPRKCCLEPCSKHTQFELVSDTYDAWVMSVSVLDTHSIWTCIWHIWYVSHVCYMSWVMSPMWHESCLLYVMRHVSYMAWVMSSIWHESCLLVSFLWGMVVEVVSRLTRESCLLYVTHMSHVSYIWHAWVMSNDTHESCLADS